MMNRFIGTNIYVKLDRVRETRKEEPLRLRENNSFLFFVIDIYMSI